MNARVLKPVTHIYTHLHRVFIGSGPLNACCRGRCERSFRRKYLLIYFCKSYFTFFLTWCANVCSGSLLYIIFFAFVYYPSLYLSCKCTTFLWRMNCAPHSERVKKESFFFLVILHHSLSFIYSGSPSVVLKYTSSTPQCSLTPAAGAHTWDVRCWIWQTRVTHPPSAYVTGRADRETEQTAWGGAIL